MKLGLIRDRFREQPAPAMPEPPSNIILGATSTGRPFKARLAENGEVHVTVDECIQRMPTNDLEGWVVAIMEVVPNDWIGYGVACSFIGLMEAPKPRRIHARIMPFDKDVIEEGKFTIHATKDVAVFVIPPPCCKGTAPKPVCPDCLRFGCNSRECLQP